MRIFVAGASGAIGRPLVERLTREGHQVTGMMRPGEDADQQSSGFYLADQDALADEVAPLRVDAPGGVCASSTMYAELEGRVLGSTRLAGFALHHGFFYGPGTWYWSAAHVRIV